MEDRMLKDATAQEKFALLKEWLPNIFQDVKKDLKNDHLKNDPKFLKKYIGKPIQKVEIEDLVNSYTTAVNEDAPHLAEFVFQRWLLRNTDIYDFFAEKLEKIDADFTELKEIDPVLSKEISEESCNQFGALKTYCFSVMNSVVFPKAVFDELSQKAKKEVKEKHLEKEEQNDLKSQEDVMKAFELKMQRTVDKYEKRISGLEKKYLADTEVLKKQIAQLQKKLA
jgi:hypothetical protein